MADLVYKKFNAFVKPDDAHIFHGFFTRIGGVSEGVCSGLNCGLGSEDNPDHVAENRGRVAGKAGVKAENLLSVYQVHGTACIQVIEPWTMQDRPKADSFVTDRAGFALGILTADCAPVLFYGQKADGAPVIGAAHAGWRGALGGVLESTVQEMLKLGAELRTIRACVGPCISRTSYEVGLEFANPFLERNEESERFFTDAPKEGHLLFDLAGYCAWRAAEAGVRHVILSDLDTYANEHEFYSYRRATHRKEDDYGRLISVISIKDHV